jgi:hypothetical protein
MLVQQHPGHDPNYDRDREDSYQGEGSSGTRYSPGPLRIALQGQIAGILPCPPPLLARSILGRGAVPLSLERGP